MGGRSRSGVDAVLMYDILKKKNLLETPFNVVTSTFLSSLKCEVMVSRSTVCAITIGSHGECSHK